MSDEQVDRAIEAVERTPLVIVPRVDDVYPWWSRLRLPLTIMCIIGLLMTGSLVALVVDDFFDDRAEQRESREREAVIEQQAIDLQKLECRQAFNDRVMQTAALTRLTSGVLDNSFNNALLDFMGGGESSINQPLLRQRIGENEVALLLDQRAVVEKNDWVLAGEPLPCPISPSDPLDVPITLLEEIP
jgi:hypothetical protein